MAGGGGGSGDAVPAEAGKPADHGKSAGGEMQPPPPPGAAVAFLNSMLHWAPFPADACKQLFCTSVRARIALLSVSVLATAMVIGDGVLTPAISVVSAIQVGIGAGGKGADTGSRHWERLWPGNDFSCFGFTGHLGEISRWPLAWPLRLAPCRVSPSAHPSPRRG